MNKIKEFLEQEFKKAVENKDSDKAMEISKMLIRLNETQSYPFCITPDTHFYPYYPSFPTSNPYYPTITCKSQN